MSLSPSSPANPAVAQNGLRNAVTAALLVLLPAIACRRAILFSLLDPPRTCEAFNHLVLNGGIGAYNRAALSLNYFEHGFIRRGLGGTLLDWIGGSPLAGCVDELLLFHLLSAIWLTVPLVLLVRRAIARDRADGAWLAVVVAASPQLFLAWGGDPGRIDMFIEGCLAWAVLALVQGWVWAALGTVLFGLLAHENAVIYGVPLLAALYAGRQPRPDLRKAGLLAAVLAGGIVAIFAGHIAFTTASPQDIVDSVLRSQAPSYKRDFAAYIAATGGKGITTSLCQSLGRPAMPFYVVGSLAIIALYAWLLRIRTGQILAYALITALPFAAVSLVAVDYGRWLSYAVFNGWLFAAATIHPREHGPSGRASYLWRAIVLAGLVAMRPTHVQYPNYFARQVAQRLWTEKGTKLKTIDACDPSWRRSIGLPAEPGYPPPGGV